ncbi:hypothetical protein ENSA5_47550 [Enhygromyxa salina]|uniref:Uncharacterized protein n=2 Tax=Enhygromyxa salina TaxID=215803 RepID=A0A2S9XIL0_9BACT|nr:hypothetical protein ENSA5_47550 [Enhygromyxa salina]
MLLGGCLLGVVLGCGESSNDEGVDFETGACPISTEGCACTSSGECDPGLVCDAQVCVAGGDTTGDGDGDTGDGDGDGDGDTGDGDTGDGDGDMSCHPLMVDCPTVGTTCTWDGAMFTCLPGIIALGDSCDPATPQCISGFCAPMGMLFDCPSNYCCAGFCNLDSPTCSQAGTQCVEYFPDGATTPNVGACLSGP